jgi:2-polyprenyl-6-methoxyphenol hydroxylase-like FAD-dependent oxidoreductase
MSCGTPFSKMSIRDIIILGAGPCGLSAALALSKTAALNPEAPELRITLIEVRSELKTIGGTLNLTPLAMRYLDSLGAGRKLRQNAINMDDGIDYISLRTGRRIANFWGGIGALRVKRYSLVDVLLNTVVQEHANRVQILWGRRVTKVSQSEDGERVILDCDDGSTCQGDVLLGCDGIHSVARSLWVDPEHKTLFTGRVVAMGWGENNDRRPPIRLSTGEPGLRDTSVVTAPLGKLLISYFEPSRTQIYLNHLGAMDEPESDAHDGWKLASRDKVNAKRDIIQCYTGGQVEGLHDLITGCEDWNVYPLYVLPKVGQWHRGRVLLMGDAVHAVSNHPIALPISLLD